MDAPPSLYVHAQFLSPATLDACAALLHGADGELAAMQPEPGAPLAVVEQVRRAWELEVPDSLHDELVAAIERLRGHLEELFAVRLEPCDGVAVLRYPPGAFYRTHRDIGRAPDPHGLHRRAVSIVIFLNSAAPRPDAAFAGGELRLANTADDDEVVRRIVPEAGTLVAFRSDLLHEVTPVASGTRGTAVTWLLRPDAVPPGAGPTARPGAA